MPTFGGGDRTKMTPGIIPERSMAPSVGSSRKMPSMCGPPWMPGWEERLSLVLWVGRHGWWNGGRRIVVAEWTFVNLDSASPSFTWSLVQRSGACSDVEVTAMLLFVFGLPSNPRGGYCLHHVHCEETESQRSRS